MPLKIELDATFTSDRIVVEDASVLADVEWQLRIPTSQQDRRLSQRVSIAKFVKHIAVDRSDFSYDHICFYDSTNDVLKFDPWLECIIRPEQVETG